MMTLKSCSIQMTPQREPSLLSKNQVNKNRESSPAVTVTAHKGKGSRQALPRESGPRWKVVVTQRGRDSCKRVRAAAAAVSQSSRMTGKSVTPPTYGQPHLQW